jgi:hypothetical protein
VWGLPSLIQTAEWVFGQPSLSPIIKQTDSIWGPPNNTPLSSTFPVGSINANSTEDALNQFISSQPPLIIRSSNIIDNLYKVAELLRLWAEYEDADVGQFNGEDLRDNIRCGVGSTNIKKRKLNRGIESSHA